MTRLLAVAALAALLTGCATPYGMNAQGGMRGMQGPGGGMQAQAGMPGHGDMQAQPGKKMGGCMHGMQAKASADGIADQRRPDMKERMQEHMQAKAEGMQKMCEMRSAPEGAGDAGAHQH